MGEIRYKLPEEVSVYTVAELKTDVLDNLGELRAEENLIFDCSNLEEIDAAGIQLLLSVVKTSLQEDFNLFLENVAPEIKETLSLVGVKEILLEEAKGNG